MRRKINIKHSKNKYERKRPKYNDAKSIDSGAKITAIEVQDVYKQDNEQKIKPKFKHNFLLLFINAFSFGYIIPRKTKEYDIQDYLGSIGNDLSMSFEKIKENYERKRS